MLYSNHLLIFLKVLLKLFLRGGPLAIIGWLGLDNIFF